AVVVAAQHAAAIADQYQAAIIEKRSACQAEFERATGGFDVDRLPAVAEITGTQQVAAQAIGQQGTWLCGTDHAEQRPLVGAFDRGPGLAVVAGAEHAALLADDEQAGVLDPGDAVEVQLVGVVQALGDVLPVLAAVGGL